MRGLLHGRDPPTQLTRRPIRFRYPSLEVDVERREAARCLPIVVEGYHMKGWEIEVLLPRLSFCSCLDFYDLLSKHCGECAAETRGRLAIRSEWCSCNRRA